MPPVVPLPCPSWPGIAAEWAPIDGMQRILNQLLRLSCRGGQLELADRHFQHTLDPVEWIVGGVRVLEDRLHFPAANPALSEFHFGAGAGGLVNPFQ